MHLIKGHLTRARAISEKFSRKTASVEDPHGQELRSGPQGAGQGEHGCLSPYSSGEHEGQTGLLTAILTLTNFLKHFIGMCH